MKIDPVADFAFSVRGFYKAEPVAAGAVALLGKDFDYVAAGNFVTKRDHLAVYLCADALMAHLGVDGVSEIDRSGACGKFEDAAFGSKSVDLVGSEIDFQGGKKFARLLQLLRPLD